jgi:hypothetical protein
LADGRKDRLSREAPLIPESVRKLIAEHIDSIEQLEVLLLLREHRGRTWTVAELSEHIRSSLTSVRGRLDGLVRRGLVEERSPNYQYAAAGELDAAVAELGRTYLERRFTVIDLIFSKPNDKLRAFADAFRVGSAKASKKGSD